MIFSGQCKEKITIIRAKQRSSNHRLTPHSLFFFLLLFLSFFLCLFLSFFFLHMASVQFQHFEDWHLLSTLDLFCCFHNLLEIWRGSYRIFNGRMWVFTGGASVYSLTFNIYLHHQQLHHHHHHHHHHRHRRQCSVPKTLPNTSSGMVCDSTDITLFATTTISRCLPLHRYHVGLPLNRYHVVWHYISITLFATTSITRWLPLQPISRSLPRHR